MVRKKTTASPVALSVWKKLSCLFDLEKQTTKKREKYREIMLEFIATGIMEFLLENLSEEKVNGLKKELNQFNKNTPPDKLLKILFQHMVTIPDSKQRLDHYLNFKFIQLTREIFKK